MDQSALRMDDHLRRSGRIREATAGRAAETENNSPVVVVEPSPHHHLSTKITALTLNTKADATKSRPLGKWAMSSGDALMVLRARQIQRFHAHFSQVNDPPPALLLITGEVLERARSLAGDLKSPYQGGKDSEERWPLRWEDGNGARSLSATINRRQWKDATGNRAAQPAVGVVQESVQRFQKAPAHLPQRLHKTSVARVDKGKEKEVLAPPAELLRRHAANKPPHTPITTTPDGTIPRPSNMEQESIVAHVEPNNTCADRQPENTSRFQNDGADLNKLTEPESALAITRSTGYSNEHFRQFKVWAIA
ncbi:hypothetical protein ACKVWC_011360 [Pyricularia oryzae]